MAINVYIWYQIPKTLNKRGELICEQHFKKIDTSLFLISLYTIVAVLFLLTYSFFVSEVGGNTQSVLFLWVLGIQLIMYLKIYIYFRKTGQPFGILGHLKKFMYEKQRKKLFHIVQGTLFLTMILFIAMFYAHHHTEIYREGLLFKYDTTNHKNALYTRFVLKQGNERIEEDELLDYIPWSSTKNEVKRLQNGTFYEETENTLTYIIQDSSKEENNIVESYYFNKEGALYKVIAEKNFPVTDIQNVDLSFLDFSSCYLDRAHTNLKGDGKFIIIDKKGLDERQKVYDEYKIIENQLFDQEDEVYEKTTPQISTVMYDNIIKELQEGYIEIESIRDCNATTIISKISAEASEQNTNVSSKMVLNLTITNSKLQ